MGGRALGPRDGRESIKARPWSMAKDKKFTHEPSLSVRETGKEGTGVGGGEQERGKERERRKERERGERRQREGEGKGGRGKGRGRGSGHTSLPCMAQVWRMGLQGHCEQRRAGLSPTDWRQMRQAKSLSNTTGFLFWFRVWFCRCPRRYLSINNNLSHDPS